MSTRGHSVRNILMTCPNDARTGGVQVVFRNLIGQLEQAGKRVFLCYPSHQWSCRMVERRNTWGHMAWYGAMPEVRHDKTFRSLLRCAVYFPLVVLHLMRVIRRTQIQVINGHYLSPYFLYFVVAARLLRVPLVVSVHGADLDRVSRARWLQRLMYRWIARGAWRIVACSHALAQQTRQLFPEARHKVMSIHNGLALEDLSEGPQACSITTPFVLSVCRQVEKKGVDTLLRAFALIQSKFPEVLLVIIGAGPALARNQALAHELGIASSVRFLGDLPREQVLPFFAACTLFVQPSRVEPFGLVLLEAAYYQKGIICTRVGGMPEIIRDHVNGLVVEPDDPAGMAEKIAVLLADPSRARQFGMQAAQTLQTKFLWKDRVKEYLAVYEASAATIPPCASPAEVG